MNACNEYSQIGYNSVTYISQESSEWGLARAPSSTCSTGFLQCRTILGQSMFYFSLSVITLSSSASLL
jgi:hypothetical protein